MDNTQTQAHTQTPQTPPQPGGLATQITYSVGLAARPKPGVLSYDGAGLLQLVDSATGSVVFSRPLNTISRVSRAEYALYFRMPGSKTTTIMFGDAKKYVLENAGLQRLDVAGSVLSVVHSNELNQQNGIEQWIQTLKASGQVKVTNFSPNTVVVASVIIAVVLVVVSFVVTQM